MDIKKEVEYLVKDCGTADLASLIKETGAYIIDDVELPKSTLGITVRSDNEIAMMVSPTLKSPKRDFVLAHELGHNILHPGQSTTFFRRFSAGLQVPKIEAEANEFALCLLLRQTDVTSSFNVLDFVRSYELPDDMIRFIKVSDLGELS